MKIWCRNCEAHTEYAFLVFEKDEAKRHWIDIICLDCQEIGVSFLAESGEVDLGIFKKQNDI
jgi:hypothetical protein